MWNADLYDRFAMERRQPSIDLAEKAGIFWNSRQEEAGGKAVPVRILDVGCGSGLSTLSLREHFPEAEITGVDLSGEMLLNAQKLLPEVSFLQRDCSEPLSDLGQYDIVFSNAFLQWLEDQEAFLRNIRENLAEGGILALQVPNFYPMPAGRAIRAVAREFPACADIGRDETRVRGAMNLPMEWYYDALSRHYGTVKLWQTNYIHQMESTDAIVSFVSGTALIPFLARLSEEEKREFMEKLHRKMMEAYPAAENGKVLFPFERLFFLACDAER